MCSRNGPLVELPSCRDREGTAHRTAGKTTRCKHRDLSSSCKKKNSEDDRPNPVVNDAKMNWSFVEYSVRDRVLRWVKEVDGGRRR